MQYFELDGVSYMDGKIFESSFTRTWNHAIWVNEEKVMVETMTEGQSARKGMMGRLCKKSEGEESWLSRL